MLSWGIWWRTWRIGNRPSSLSCSLDLFFLLFEELLFLFQLQIISGEPESRPEKFENSISFPVFERTFMNKSTWSPGLTKIDPLESNKSL
jgi:hypothetical protein